jgi:hypothetical protein
LCRGDHAFQLADRIRDVEVLGGELGDGLVAECLHPALQFFGAVELAALVLVEGLDRLVHARARLDLPRDPSLLVDHAAQLFDAPLVGLVEIDDGAEEVAGPQRVDVATHRVVFDGLRREFGLEEFGELAVGIR